MMIFCFYLLPIYFVLYDNKMKKNMFFTILIFKNITLSLIFFRYYVQHAGLYQTFSIQYYFYIMVLFDNHQFDVYSIGMI